MGNLRPKAYTIIESLGADEWEILMKHIQEKLPQGSDIYRLIIFFYNQKNDLPSIESVQSNLFMGLSRKAVSNKLYLAKKFIINFIIEERQRNETDVRDIILFEEYLSRGLIKDAIKIKSKIERKLNKASTHDIDSFYYLHLLAHKFFFSSYRNDFSSLYQNSLNSLKRYMDHIEYMYNIEARFRTDILEIQHKDCIGYRQNPSNDLSTCFELLNDLLFNNNSQAYSKLVAILKDWEIGVKSEPYTFILLHLINFIRRIEKESLSFEDNRLLNLYDLALRQGVYRHRGYMSTSQFENMIDVGCTKGDLVWIRKILKNYIKEIHPYAREEVLKMAQAHIYYYEDNYRASLDVLYDLQLKFLDHKLRSRWLIIMCLYELGEKEQLETSLNAFSTFIRGHKSNMSNYSYQGILNFIKFVRKLQRNVAKDKLLNEIRNTSHITKASWIVKKAKRLGLENETKHIT